MTIRKNSGVLRDLLLEKMNKKEMQKQLQFRFVVCNRFVFSAFRPYYGAVVQCNTVGNFAYSLAQIWLKWRSSGLIKRYILRQ